MGWDCSPKSLQRANKVRPDAVVAVGAARVWVDPSAQLKVIGVVTFTPSTKSSWALGLLAMVQHGAELP